MSHFASKAAGAGASSAEDPPFAPFAEGCIASTFVLASHVAGTAMPSGGSQAAEADPAVLRAREATAPGELSSDAVEDLVVSSKEKAAVGAEGKGVDEELEKEAPARTCSFREWRLREEEQAQEG
eukprot:jgi/Mesvir1/15756/Mv03328-RA.1